MAINFPNSPSIDDTHVVGDMTFVGDGVKWVASGSGGGGVVISDTAPTGNDPFWGDSVSGRLLIKYDDGASTQWVETNFAKKGEQGIQGETGPTGPTGPTGDSGVVELTQSQYDALGTPDADTLYVIT